MDAANGALNTCDPPHVVVTVNVPDDGALVVLMVPDTLYVPPTAPHVGALILAFIKVIKHDEVQEAGAT